LKPSGNDRFNPNFLKGWYFQYSRGEKRGMAILVLLILFLFVLPGLWKILKPLPELTIALSDGSAVETAASATSAKPDSQELPIRSLAPPHPIDPNLASADELTSMGFSRKTVRNILRYREKGGVFRRKEDVLRIWGIDTQLVTNLFPYIKVQVQTAAESSNVTPGHSSRNHDPALWEPLDVNLADSFALLRLTGIGSKLAARIVAYREKLGGFHSLSQLKEVYGMNVETINALCEKNRWHIGKGVFRKIQLNRADAAGLKHPYISKIQAMALEAYRSQHGPFRDSSALRAVLSFSSRECTRLLPYLDYGH
jgi:competence ComEA-like helix-hairpin-helix protein